MANIEIERKFLVSGNYKAEAYASQRIVQGYIVNEKERNVRIRIKGDKGYITIKGETGRNGISRFEWEREISKEDAEDLLKLCNSTVIDKVRHLVKVGGHTFEVDEFEGENRGLVVAELELQSENEPYERPSWLGEEVTGDNRYYNAQLVLHPFSTWQND
jgi:CYTH domain-containing protein